MSRPSPIIAVVEGESDAIAVAALATKLGSGPRHARTRICSAGGVTNFARVLAEFASSFPDAEVVGMYDLPEERHVRRALVRRGAALVPDGGLEPHGFFACVDDLEDELIRAVGADGVERVLDREGEIRSFRRFQAMPQHRDEPVDAQLHRFLGTRATRKIRMAGLLVDVLDPMRAPRALRLVASRLVGHET